MKKLLLLFFENEKYPGWRNIAEKLIDNGSCTVAGNECLWIGGIGNFITTKPDENAYDCLLYTFDLETFKKSKWFEEVKEQYLNSIYQEISHYREMIEKLGNEIDEINS